MDRAPVDGIELEYEVRGSGEPVVLIHAGVCADFFRPLIEQRALASRHTVLSYHRVGYAGSIRLHGAVSLAQQAEHCRALMRHLGIGRAHVVGHSSSASMALQLALDAPDAVQSLVLLDPARPAAPTALHMEMVKTVVEPALEQYGAGDKPGAVDTWMRGVCGPEYRTALGQALPDAFEQAAADADTFFGQELPAVMQWTFGREEAARIAQPALVVTGEHSIPVFRERRDLLLSWLPNVEAFELPDATHLLHVQDPGAMATALVAFFSRHPLASTALPARVGQPDRSGRSMHRRTPRTPATNAEGTVAFRGYRTWYRIVGDLPASGGRLPLLVLHGGPGFPHNYLGDLAGLADSGRIVVFYDQLGCGKSDHPDDPALWVMDTFAEEVATVREALRLDSVHLLGHSWGGWLALEYALRRPAGLTSLILASTCASLPAFAQETQRLKKCLPADVQEIIDRHEAQGTTDDPAYANATMAYYSQWICRLDPFPQHVMHSFEHISEDVYGTMQGPEWNVTGNLRDWDVTTRLGELDLPVLVTSGRYDAMTPALVQPLVTGIRGAEHVTFQESSHLAMAEEPARYRDALKSFLSRVEATQG